MRNRKKLLFLFVLVLSGIFIFQSCENYDEEFISPNAKSATADSLGGLSVPSGFDYVTTQQLDIDIAVLSNNDLPLSGVLIEVYDRTPYPNPNVRTAPATLLFRGLTSADGHLKTRISVPAYLEEIVVSPRYIGVAQEAKLPVTGGEIAYQFGGVPEKSVASKSMRSKSGDYLYLGDWDTQGVPLYLEADDPISADLLQMVNASLPERVSVPDFHPEYLDDDISTNIRLKAEAEVWITFVHEGAGWKNTLGYYTYPTENPPQTAEEIENLTVIFPNVSYEHSGGGLHSGNKVKLKYYDPEIEDFRDSFPAHVSIGWFIVANSWSDEQIGEGYYTHYSDYENNVETDPELQQHNVLLIDQERELLLVGFEDIRRDRNYCDHDFNDAVFYTKIEPFSAIDENDYGDTDTDNDTDNDEVDDPFDDYPDDPERAFDNYTQGALAFEDLWPSKGDYDFNDLVTDYEINCVTNAENQVVDVLSTFTFRAIGAGFHNGFGFEMPVPADAVAGVEGGSFEQGYIATNANGTEAGQENAVIIVCEDAYDVLSAPNGGFVNVYNHVDFVPFETIQVDLTFTTPQSWGILGTPPFNPFMIKNGNRTHEIHLPNYTPTALANQNMFGNSDDDSQPGQGKYYLTADNLPWAIHLPESFENPKERAQVSDAYLHFAQWAESNGTLYPDWFQDKPGYRNTDKIYQFPQ